MDALQCYDSDNDEEAPSKERTSDCKRQRTDEGSQRSRIRSFPHIEGNYATHVYIQVDVTNSVQGVLRDVLWQARQGLPELQTGSDLLPSNNQSIADIPRDFHISLSRVVALRHPDIKTFLDAMRDHLRDTSEFEVSLKSLEVYTNDERQRTFLALGVYAGKDQVCRCIRRTNKVFLQHGLQVFYKDPRPHASIAWLVGDQEAALQQHVAKAETCFTGEGVAGRDLEWSQKVSTIYCKIGKQVHVAWKAAHSELRQQ